MKKSRITSSMRAGLGYERDVKEFLLKEYGDKCRVGQWFLYTTELTSQVAYCQIDAFVVLEDEKKILVIESKLKHTVDAWNQLELLYVPILKKVYGAGYKYCSIEICRLYDPTIGNSFPHHAIESLSDATPKDFSVFRWKK